LFTTRFDPEGPSSGNTNIKITMNSYGFKIVLCINEISFLQLIGLKLRVIGVRIDVDCTVDFVESG